MKRLLSRIFMFVYTMFACVFIKKKIRLIILIPVSLCVISLTAVSFSGNVQYYIAKYFYKHTYQNVLYVERSLGDYWLTKAAINNHPEALKYKGLQALDEGKYPFAFSLLLQSEDIKQDPFIELYLGKMYEHGIGTKQDFNKAFYYYQKSLVTSDNYPALLYEAGRMLVLGKGVQRDVDTGIQMIKQSAFTNPIALIFLAKYYSSYKDETKDIPKAIEYYGLFDHGYNHLYIKLLGGDENYQWGTNFDYLHKVRGAYRWEGITAESDRMFNYAVTDTESMFSFAMIDDNNTIINEHLRLLKDYCTTPSEDDINKIKKSYKTYGPLISICEETSCYYPISANNQCVQVGLR